MGINSYQRFFGASGAVMLTHGKIWIAIDALARRYGLSPSGLAKRAGLPLPSTPQSG